MVEFAKMDSGPATSVALITPSDTINIRATRGIRANTAGTIKITDTAGNEVICNFAAAETRPIAATRIWSTSTTATGIEAMY